MEMFPRLWTFLCFRAMNNDGGVVRIYGHIYNCEYDINNIFSFIIIITKKSYHYICKE